MFLASAGFVLWQNSQVVVLWDVTYLLDTAWRIALGQVPYRDFPLVHPPLTFVIQALLMRLFGRVYLVPVVYAAILNGLGTVIAWRILLRVLRWRIVSAYAASFLLALPLIFLGIHGIYPQPIYDCDCAFAILVAIFLLQRLGPIPAGSRDWLRSWLFPLGTGAATVVPVFFKQNMGLPFLLAVAVGLLLLLLRNLVSDGRTTDHRGEGSSQVLLSVLAGMILSAFFAAGLLEAWSGLDNYLHWTVHFAAERRLPGLANLIDVYRQPSFLWTLPALGVGLVLLNSRSASRLWSRFGALLLCAAPFFGSLIYLLIQSDPDERADNLLSLWPLILVVSMLLALFTLRRGLTLARLTPFFVLAAIHGTFLSQQLWGSTYAIWALLLILVASTLAELPRTLRQIPLLLAAVISGTFLICGGLYAASDERLNYIRLNSSEDEASSPEPLVHTTVSSLCGMAARGPYIGDFEELLRFADREIPADDAILLLPGEEPFYYASGRTPQFPVSIFDHTTDPYSPAELMQEARKRNVRWVIVKTRLQSTEDPLPAPDETLRLVEREFVLDRRLAGYEVYLRR